MQKKFRSLILPVPKFPLGKPFLRQAPPGKDYEIENYRPLDMM
jgi:hypothetical protein